MDQIHILWFCPSHCRTHAKYLTLYCPYLYSYPIGIALFKRRLMSPLGQQRVKEPVMPSNLEYLYADIYI